MSSEPAASAPDARGVAPAATGLSGSVHSSHSAHNASPTLSNGSDLAAALPVSRRQTGRHLRTAALVAVGLAALGAVLYYVGVGQVLALMQSLGWWAPLVLVPYGVIMIFDVFGWGRALAYPSRRLVSFWKLYWIRLAGEAVNNLTPTAGLAGEPVKAYLLRQHGVGTSDGVASVVIAKGAIISSQIVFTLIGLFMLLDWLDLLRARGLLLIGCWVVGLGIVLGMVVWQRRGVVGDVARLLRNLGLRGSFIARLESRAAEIDGSLARFYREDPRGFAATTLYHFAGWMLGAGEVVLFLWMMGISCGWEEAIIIESLSQAVLVSGAVIPGGLGVQEFSGAVLCRLLGFSEPAGVALMLLKRIRELAFSLLGLAALTYLSRGAAAHQEQQ